MAVEVKAAATERAGVGVWGFPPPLSEIPVCPFRKEPQEQSRGRPKPLSPLPCTKYLQGHAVDKSGDAIGGTWGGDAHGHARPQGG